MVWNGMVMVGDTFLLFSVHSPLFLFLLYCRSSWRRWRLGFQPPNLLAVEASLILILENMVGDTFTIEYYPI